MKIVVTLLLAAVASIYALFWFSFMAFVAVGFASNPSEGVELFYSADGPDGIAGPLFLWFLILANPIILLALRRTWVERRDRKLKEKI